jgi:hypothetical protein
VFSWSRPKDGSFFSQRQPDNSPSEIHRGLAMRPWIAALVKDVNLQSEIQNQKSETNQNVPTG